MYKHYKDASLPVDESSIVVRDSKKARQFNGQKRKGGRKTKGQQISTGVC